MKAKFLLILRITISVGLVLFLLWSMRGQFPQIALALSRTNFALFFFAILLFAVDVCLPLSARTKLLFDGEGLNISFSKVMQLSFIGYFFNNFMPTAVGGDIVKAYYANKQTKKTAKSFIAVFMDRFIGLFTFVCIAVLAILISWDIIDVFLKKVVIVFVAIGAIFLLVTLNTAIARVILKGLSRFKLWNVGEHLSKIYRAVHEYRNKKAVILGAMGISVVAQSMYFSVIYLLAKSLGIELPLKTVFLIMPVVSVVSMLPSLGGLGLREGAIVYLFKEFIGVDNAFSVSILFLATLLAISLVGAIIYVFASQFKIKKAEMAKIEGYSI